MDSDVFPHLWNRDTWCMTHLTKIYQHSSGKLFELPGPWTKLEYSIWIIHSHQEIAVQTWQSLQNLLLCFLAANKCQHLDIHVSTQNAEIWRPLPWTHHTQFLSLQPAIVKAWKISNWKRFGFENIDIVLLNDRNSSSSGYNIDSNRPNLCRYTLLFTFCSPSRIQNLQGECDNRKLTWSSFKNNRVANTIDIRYSFSQSIVFLQCTTFFATQICPCCVDGSEIPNNHLGCIPNPVK